MPTHFLVELSYLHTFTAVEAYNLATEGTEMALSNAGTAGSCCQEPKKCFCAG